MNMDRLHGLHISTILGLSNVALTAPLLGVLLRKDAAGR
jgi:hypothetical protein